MKRHTVMDLFHGNRKEVADEEWKDVTKELPKLKKDKVRVQSFDGSEHFAYYYEDKGIFSAYSPHKEGSYFWNATTHEPMLAVRAWKNLKQVE